MLCLVSEQPLNKRRKWRRRRGNKKGASQINVTWTEAMDWSPFPWPRSNPHWSPHTSLHCCLVHLPCWCLAVVYEGLCIFNLLSSFDQIYLPCLKLIHMVSQYKLHSHLLHLCNCMPTYYHGMQACLSSWDVMYDEHQGAGFHTHERWVKCPCLCKKSLPY